MSQPQRLFRRSCLLLPLLLGVSGTSHAFDWSTTELHLQYGSLDVPRFAGGGSADHFIYTLQHANGWKYGDNFFFVDVLDSQQQGFQDFDIYGEAYANFSYTKITGQAIRAGPISDIGLLLGINLGADAKVKKYLPGIRLSLSLPGFAFANLDIAARLDDSKGVASGGAPKEQDSFLVDFNFARPFSIGEANFSIEGHLEYIGKRENEFGAPQEAWILFQPQLRWRANDRLSLGFEYQYWRNKLGDSATDENTVQALLVWTF